MEIIVPAAGLSTRFPNMRPKYTLTAYDGDLMIEKSLGAYIGKCNITVGLLKQHEEKHSIIEYLTKKHNNKIKFVVLDKPTSGPAETVYKILEKANIENSKEIFVKDCDSFFDHEPQEGNYVCVSNMKDHEVLKRVGSKSFVTANDQGIVHSIIEKEIVSDKFCVGGYKFSSAKLYKDSYKELKKLKANEIFVSHVIDNCLSKNEVFKIANVTNYTDVGTAEDWFEYNDKSVIFCDIDGTLIKAQPRGTWHTKPDVLENNVKTIKEQIEKGSMVIFTTARPKSAEQDTIHMLETLGFTDIKIISDLPNTKRILINDYNDANPYPRARAINIRRDTDNLKDFLK